MLRERDLTISLRPVTSERSCSISAESWDTVTEETGHSNFHDFVSEGSQVVQGSAFCSRNQYHPHISWELLQEQLTQKGRVNSSSLVSQELLKASKELSGLTIPELFHAEQLLQSTLL